MTMERLEKTGSGPAMLLVHGVGLDLHIWDWLVPELEEGFTLYRYDMIGHGARAGLGRALRLDDFMEQLGAVIDQIGEPPVLVGFSMGAMISALYASERSEKLSKLVLMSGVYQRDESARAGVMSRLKQAEEDGPQAIIDAALARWLTPDFATAHPEIVTTIRQRLEGNDRQDFLNAYRVFATGDRSLEGRVQRITCPTLVMTGELDSGSTPDMARRLAEDIPNTQAEILSHLAHLAPVEGAARVASALKAFTK